MTTSATEERGLSRSSATPAKPAWDQVCLNCGTMLGDAFCSRCGQRAVPPHPSFREIAGDALNEFAGWDGKLAETLRSLITKPGQLTTDFLDGKRARYLSPLRLYLSCSVVYFLLAAIGPNARQTQLSVGLPRGNDSVKKAVYFGISDGAGLTDAQRQAALAGIDSAPRILRPVMRRVAKDPKGLQNDVFASLPKALFALLPVFAGILALFYRKRHFVEHLYYAFHVHAFVFVALSLVAAARLLRLPTLSFVAGVAVLIWIPVYGHLSLRRTYGGSHGSTLMKELGIGTLYVAAAIPMLTALAMLVAWHQG